MGKQTRLLRACLLAVLALLAAACQPRPMPGSFLLTPLAQNPASQTPSPVPATLSPTASATPSATLTETPLPTPTSSSTATRVRRPTFTQTWDGTPSRTPTRTVVPTRTRRPSSTPTPTRTPTPPLAHMRINRPGPYSKVSSPFRFESVIMPGADGLVQLRLKGEDGRELQALSFNFRGYEGMKVAANPAVTFDLAAVSEIGRLDLYTVDAYNRVNYLTSVDLILLKIGDSEFEPAPEQREPFILRLPREKALVSGGKLTVSGLARLINDRPLIVELLDQDGRILDSAELEVTQPTAVLSHIPFSVDLTYQVEKLTEALVVIRQESATRIPGTVALSSRPVRLKP